MNKFILVTLLTTLLAGCAHDSPAYRSMILRGD